MTPDVSTELFNDKLAHLRRTAEKTKAARKQMDHIGEYLKSLDKTADGEHIETMRAFLAELKAQVEFGEKTLREFAEILRKGGDAYHRALCARRDDIIAKYRNEMIAVDNSIACLQKMKEFFALPAAAPQAKDISATVVPAAAEQGCKKRKIAMA